MAEADLPPGVFNLVLGPGPEVGDEIAGHPDTVAVSFIGSTRTGTLVAQRAAGKALLLEMGNNGPIVVMDDADVDAAEQASIVGAFLCAGQSCTAAERLLVHEDVHEAFVSRLVDATAERVRLGDPFAETATMGPLNNEPVAATEETFGPIAPVVRIGSLEEAIAQTNALPYGLLAAIFTRDVMAGLRFAESVRAGIVNVNESSNYWESHLPFGGGAGSASGVGRVGGRYPMLTLTELQTVTITG